MKRLLDAVVTGAGWIAGIATILMMLHVTVDVAGRQLFGHPLTGTVEIVSAYNMIALAFLPLALIARERGHIIVELFTGWMKMKPRTLLDAFVAIITLVYTSVFTWKAIEVAIDKTEIREAKEAGIGSWKSGRRAGSWLSASVSWPFTYSFSCCAISGQALPGRYIRKTPNVMAAIRPLTSIQGRSSCESRTSRFWQPCAGSLPDRHPHADRRGARVVAFLGFWFLRNERVAFAVMQNTPFEVAANWGLSAIPMFILMGAVAHSAGISEALFKAARLWLSSLPGGLAVATNMASAGFAAASALRWRRRRPWAGSPFRRC